MAGTCSSGERGNRSCNVERRNSFQEVRFMFEQGLFLLSRLHVTMQINYKFSWIFPLCPRSILVHCIAIYNNSKCLMPMLQTYLELAQECVVNENILLQTLSEITEKRTTLVISKKAFQS